MYIILHHPISPLLQHHTHHNHKVFQATIIIAHYKEVSKDLERKIKPQTLNGTHRSKHYAQSLIYI